MNGLRYHYQHSGEHGAHGLALLANGMHHCLSLTKGSATGSSSMQNSRHPSRQGSRERILERSSGVATPVQQQVQANLAKPDATHDPVQPTPAAKHQLRQAFLVRE
jgi:transcription factor SFP1